MNQSYGGFDFSLAPEGGETVDECSSASFDSYVGFMDVTKRGNITVGKYVYIVHMCLYMYFFVGQNFGLNTSYSVSISALFVVASSYKCIYDNEQCVPVTVLSLLLQVPIYHCHKPVLARRYGGVSRRIWAAYIHSGRCSLMEYKFLAIVPLEMNIYETPDVWNQSEM